MNNCTEISLLIHTPQYCKSEQLYQYRNRLRYIKHIDNLASMYIKSFSVLYLSITEQEDIVNKCINNLLSARNYRDIDDEINTFIKQLKYKIFQLNLLVDGCYDKYIFKQQDSSK